LIVLSLLVAVVNWRHIAESSVVRAANSRTVNDRMVVWTTAWEMAKDYPLFGTGHGWFGKNYAKYFTFHGNTVTTDFAHNITSAHNSYIRMWVEGGPLLVLLYLLMLVMMMRRVTQLLIGRLIHPSIGRMEVMVSSKSDPVHAGTYYRRSSMRSTRRSFSSSSPGCSSRTAHGPGPGGRSRAPRVQACPVRLAILAPSAGPAFLGEVAQGQGGAERQLAALGQALAARGHQVDVILDSDSEAAAVGGIGLWPVYPRGGLPLVKLLHPKGTALLSFLRARGTEVLLQRGAAELTGLGWLATRLAGIGFVHAVASDSDLEAGQELLPHAQDRVLFRLGLLEADQLVVQTQAQQRALQRAIGRGDLVRSFPEAAPAAVAGTPTGTAVLWGGNLRPVKRPEWLLSLAASLPQQAFVVFGGAARGHERYARGIQAALRDLPNVDYLGALPPSALPAVYARCRTLIVTSAHEVSPIQCWRPGSMDWTWWPAWIRTGCLAMVRWV
jgi:hypothetical protein